MFASVDMAREQKPDFDSARILWLSQDEISSMRSDPQHATFPGYIQGALELMDGRPANGNFFCTDALRKHGPRIERSGNAADAILDRHGLLILRHDVPLFDKWAGIWTDMKLTRLS